MTGYGRGVAEGPGLKIQVEMRGVNNKGLDIQFRLPPALMSQDMACRKAVRETVSRGRVDVRVFLELIGEEAVEVRYSEGSAVALGRLAADLEKRGILARGMTLHDLLSLPEAVRIGLAPEKEPEAGKLLLAALEEALAAFTATRKAEGERLRDQFSKGLETLRKYAEEAEKAAEAQHEACRSRLVQKMEAMEVTLDPGRLEQEVALAAERADVAEELVRLKAHGKAFAHLLEEEGKSLGKRMDHLLQEMQREVSTLLAKADVYELTQAGLAMRYVVEQLREQVLNVA